MIVDVVHAAAYCAIALWLLTAAGNWMCQNLLSLTGLRDARAGSGDELVRAGRVIGWLERLLIALGIVTGQWEVLAGVIALKSVARFKELDHKLSAEYFLVGSLFSLLWAAGVTAGWIAYDAGVGIGIADVLAGLLDMDLALPIA